MFKAQCHCGNVQLSVEQLPQTLTSCNCSVCRRYATLWGYYSVSEVELSLGDEGVGSYQWGDGYIKFHHCRRCGCITHYTSTDKSPVKKVAINFRMSEPDLICNIPVRKFDGAKTWKYLDD